MDPDAPLRFLSEDDAARLAPAPAEAIALGRRALVALATGLAELPPKPAVHPREDGFANAMPAYLGGEDDLLGVKWIAAYRSNRAAGLPAINGVIVMSDAATGMPVAVLGAARLTGVRTAGVSGACIEALAPERVGHVAITGAGLQARTHLAVCEALGLRDVRVFARRAQAGSLLEAWAERTTPHLRVRCVQAAADAVEGAGVVITAVPIGAEGARLPPGLLRDDALILPLDYATSIGADVANEAALFADHVGQLLQYRDAGAFPAYDEPLGAVGAVLDAPRPAGRVVCQNLGTGAADLLFADAVIRAAEAQGVGTLVAR